ncbi:carbohydrate ABC transporter permease [Neobacillus cucumis]|uniref:Arabinose transporter permease n=1 Tax=Neobacillus cucumis TaxID=1740721 RepID=A0A2N5HVN4_9BACI|nr:sugar ABC transporter permease [Neobacillus cucumis]PLS09580.1 arabinose transporter permease [Neobacillus cucumis]
MKPELNLSIKNKETVQRTKNNIIKNLLFSQKITPYVMVSPFIILFLVFFLYPLLSTINMSFYKILPGESTFIGLENYKRLWNPDFFLALKNSAVYTLWTLVVLIPIPLLFSVFLNSHHLPGKEIFRSALFMPILTSVIVGGVIFKLMFAQSDTALINSIITKLGFNSHEWLMEKGSGMFMMVMLASWRWLGVNILYFLSGLQNIPKELYEAADIDGANKMKKFFLITVPLLRPVTVYVTTISIFAGFRMFEESYALWQGQSPSNIGLTVVGYIYRQGFQFNDMGFGAAIGVVLLIIVLTVNLIQLKYTGAFKKED